MRILICIVLLVWLRPAATADVDNASLANEADGNNWGAYGRTFSEQRFSPLDQVDRNSVRRLGLAWTYEFSDVWNVSSQPLAVDGIVYVAVGYSVVYAFDGASGKLLWRYDPHMGLAKMRYAWGIRGLAFWKGKVYVGVQDGRLVALDAKNGQLLWETLTTEPGDNRYITGAPRVFNDKVLIGHGGADFGGVRGYVTAYDAQTGRQVWRFYAVPGDPAKGFENPAMAMAAKTWTGQWWKDGGGGTAWNAMTYDPELNRVYIGTGNGSPWNRKLRSPGGGDNLFLCSIVALDADTGQYIWHYQTNPGESWDFNSAMDMVLATLDIGGRPRKVLLHAPKNGFFYVIDRENGKLISAGKIAKITWAERIDLTTGRPVEVRGARYEDGEILMWPGSSGAHNWQPMAFSPDTHLAYIPAREIPGYYNDKGLTPQTWNPKELPLGINAFFGDVPKEAGTSSLLAWDPVQQKEVWRQPTPGLTNGGVIVTHGGLVFQGRADGRFVAYDANSGAELWSRDMGVGTQAAPITYTVQGKQYVSILAGWAGGQLVLGSLSAQHGWVGRSHPPQLLTYALDANVPLSASSPPKQVSITDDPTFQVDPALAEQGKILYQRCLICHGPAVVAGGFPPDLRASSIPLSAEAFKAIVQGGALTQRGMPVFSELSDQDLLAMRHYIRQRARYKPSTWSQLEAAWSYLELLTKAQLAKWGW